MTFKNEYIPHVEDETSEFLKQARKTLNVGHASHEMWTVDREDDIVMVRTGGGRWDTADDESWRLVDRTGAYSFVTTVLKSKPLSDRAILIKRSIGFRHIPDLDDDPTRLSITVVKGALQAYKDNAVISQYESCELILVDLQGNQL